MRALMDKVHADAKAAAFAAVTPVHAGAIAALAAQVTAKTLDPRSASEQIDGLLTGNEQNAVLAAARKSRQEMFAAMQAAGGPGPMMGGGPPGMSGRPPGMGGGPAGMGGGPPGMAGGPSGMGGGGPSGGGPDGGREHRGGHQLSAGRYLLMLSMPPGQMRQLMPRARSSAAP